MRKMIVLAGILLLVGAGDPWTDASSQDLQGYARALSLDLRGNVPAAEELLVIEEAGEIPEELLDSWLNSTEILMKLWEGKMDVVRIKFIRNLVILNLVSCY